MLYSDKNKKIKSKKLHISAVVCPVFISFRVSTIYFKYRKFPNDMLAIVFSEYLLIMQ